MEQFLIKDHKSFTSLSYYTALAMAPLLVILVWVFYSSIVFFLGAELSYAFLTKFNGEEEAAPEKEGAGRWSPSPQH